MGLNCRIILDKKEKHRAVAIHRKILWFKDFWRFVQKVSL